MIRIEDLSLAYGQNQVLKNISFSVPEGMIMGLVGKSGAGKTSLLKSMAYLLQDYQGTITYGDKDIRALSPKERATTVGFVFQDYRLFANMTVLQNCTRPLEIVLGMTREEALDRACLMLRQVGMADKVDANPSELSGGQKQRVAIARALGLRPQVLLMDEPTAALDPENRDNLKGVLRELVSEGITIIICSHDIPFVSAIADEILTLRCGGIKQT